MFTITTDLLAQADEATLPAVAGTLPSGRDPLEMAPTFGQAADKRTTMPKGGYRFGRSNPRLRPSVPEGE